MIRSEILSRDGLGARDNESSGQCRAPGAASFCAGAVIRRDSGVVVRAGLGCVTRAIRNSADLSKPSWADLERGSIC